MRGVVATRVGFTGGPSSAPSPTYESVCDDDGHTEVVRVTYDPKLISYDDILAEFWVLSGSRATKPRSKAQYKSVIWATSDEQFSAAQVSKEKISLTLGDVPIVTEILPFDEVWHDAPERHQRYVMKHRETKARRAADAQNWVDDWTERGKAGSAD
jgi:peptide-methionine (S)-S-oxide reductase